MRSEIDIINGLSAMLRENFPTIEQKPADKAEGFERSCFAVQILSSEDSQVGEMEEINANVDLYYFCKDINYGYAELLMMKKNLSKLLKHPIKVSGGFYYTCDNISHTISLPDKALAVNFDVQLVQDYEKDTDIDYTMQKLIINKEEA